LRGALTGARGRPIRLETASDAPGVRRRAGSDRSNAWSVEATAIPAGRTAVTAKAGRSRALGEIVASDWLTVSQAAAAIGVGAATVRRWTAAGRLNAFITPGGHRRYNASDVLRLVGRPGRATRAFSAEELGALWTARGATAAREAQAEGWFGAFSEAEKAAARDHGRALLALAARFVANPSERDDANREAALLAVAYAEQAARVWGSLGELLCAFGHFRRPLYAVVAPPDETATGHDGIPRPIHAHRGRGVCEGRVGPAGDTAAAVVEPRALAGYHIPAARYQASASPMVRSRGRTENPSSRRALRPS